MEFEKAYNCIIMHRYKTAYTIFSGLYNNEQDNSSYLNGCIVSLVLMGNTNELYYFIKKESGSSKRPACLNLIAEKIQNHIKPEIIAFEKLSIFNLFISIIEALRRGGFTDDTDIFVRTAMLLKPNNPLLYRYLAEKALKSGSIEKGCSYITKAAELWITSVH